MRLLITWGVALATLVHADDEVVRVVRGVAPSLATKYAGQDAFTCLDATRTIPIGQVNDDYCDCADGSDEPGTSACANGSFYCVNKGYHSKSISASFVNDGVCDCCDGSDEWAKADAAGCEATCMELGASMIATLKREADGAKQGAAHRQQYVADALQVQKEWAATHAATLQQISALQPTVDALRVRKNAAERAERKVEAEREKLSAANAAAESAAAAAGSDENGEAAEAEEAGQAEGAEPDVEEAESEAERGQRIAAQWTTNAEAAGEGAGIVGEETEDQQEGEDYVEEELSAEAAAVDMTPFKPQKPADWNDADDGVWEPPEEYEADLLRKEYDSHHSKLTELQEVKRKLDDKLKADYGPDAAFLALHDKCVEIKVNQYTYEVCPFASSTQKEGAGAGTSLGTWGGFSDAHGKMLFTGGATCWNGPARSLTVTLLCGDTEALFKVEEPARCEYVAEMTTPAVCSAQHLLTIKAKAASLGLSHDELR